MSPCAYVMFGQSALFGDYFGIIRSRGDALTKVVVNVPDPTPPGRKNFHQRLEEANRILADAGAGYKIAVEQIDQFQPRPGERYIIGFRSPQLCPLRDRLRGEFSLRFESIVHRSAVVPEGVRLGEGVIVNAGSVVGSAATIGDYCLVNRAASVGHDAQIHDFAIIGPGAHLASGVTIGRAAVVGVGATVIENVVVGEGAVIGAGAVVLKDVDAKTVVAGVPARVIARKDAAPVS